MQPTVDDALRSDIREMGRVLGEVIREQWGEDFLQLEEEVRSTMRTLREQPDAERLRRLLSRLEHVSLSEIERLVRSFTTYFHIANTADFRTAGVQYPCVWSSVTVAHVEKCAQ